MQSDVRGCSTCPTGREQYEYFTAFGRERIQYDFRTAEGRLFSTVAVDLTSARKKRDAWLAKLPEQERQIRELLAAVVRQGG